jgi:hypothetical protein
MSRRFGQGPIEQYKQKASTPAVVGWERKRVCEAGDVHANACGGCKRVVKANHRHQRRRLAEKLLAVYGLDRALNDVAMAGFWSTPADQAQILFPRQLSQSMNLAARRAARVKQLFS